MAETGEHLSPGRYRIDMSYLGTRYHGFQAQPGGNTIQDHLEKALGILLGHPCRIRGASRTDSGVHAHHQVAAFSTSRPYKDRWLMGLNALTPEDIGIMDVRPAADNFDPVCDSTGKAYCYRLWRGRCFNPFVRPYVWELGENLCPKELEKLARVFTGRHDFRAFCNKDSDAKSTVREILDIRAFEYGPVIELWFTGRGFLKQMIRILTGTLVQACLRRQNPEELRALLGPQASRGMAGATAPPQGLCLVRVFFDEIEEISELTGKARTGFCFDLPEDHRRILSIRG